MTRHATCVLAALVEKGPILLQHHGNPLQFRNIFIKPLAK